MKLKTLMLVNAVVAVIFGVAFVVAPSWSMGLYGNSPDAVLELTGQLFGGSLVAFAVLTWFARNSGESDARRAIILSMLVGDAIGFVVSLIGQLGGVLNSLGWLNVAIYLLLALGFGYFTFMKPTDS